MGLMKIKIFEIFLNRNACSSIILEILARFWAVMNIVVNKLVKTFSSIPPLQKGLYLVPDTCLSQERRKDTLVQSLQSREATISHRFILFLTLSSSWSCEVFLNVPTKMQNFVSQTEMKVVFITPHTCQSSMSFNFLKRGCIKLNQGIWNEHPKRVFFGHHATFPNIESYESMVGI